MQNEKNTLSVPMAIVGAGIIIALGIYFSNHKSAEPVPAENQNKVQSINIRPVSNTDHILGDANAPIVIVEFSDLECPFCKTFETTMNSLISTYAKDGKLAWVYRDFPLNIHPRSEKESEASECANELGGGSAFWKYTEEVFKITTSNNTLPPEKLPIIAKDIGLDLTAFNACLSSGKYAALITSETNDALASGAQGTPYSVMILKNPLSSSAETNINNFAATNGLSNNVLISGDKKEIVLNGALPLQLIQQIIDYILK